MVCAEVEFRPWVRHFSVKPKLLSVVYFKVAPRQTISAAVLPKVRTPLVLHHSAIRTAAGGARRRGWEAALPRQSALQTAAFRLRTPPESLTCVEASMFTPSYDAVRRRMILGTF